MQDLICAEEAIARQRSAQPPLFLDCSFYLPTQNKDAAALFAAQHIPGAQFFDINAIADRSSPLPHMMPSAEVFSAGVGALGVTADRPVVLYDQVGLFSAARGWLTFKQFGHREAYVLNGGLPAWIRAGGETSSAAETLRREDYRAAEPDRSRVVSASAVIEALDRGETVIDARPAGRFWGRDPEPRPGMRGGHMPGASSLPHSRLLTEDGRLKSRAELRKVFAEAGIELGLGPLTTTCGSGVTAAVISFALYQLGIEAPVYDGSWAEWGDPQSGYPVTTD